MKVITDFHRSWLTNNYGKVTSKECAARLGVSERTICRWAKEFGLTNDRVSKITSKPSKKVVKVVEVTPDIEAEKGYCVDCKHYVLGGECEKTGKLTGALNEKPCFKRNTL